LTKYQRNFVDTIRYSAKKNPNAYPVIRFGTTPLNYYPTHPLLCQDDYSPSLNSKKKRCKNLSKNIYDMRPSANPGAPMQQTSSLLRKRTESYAQYKIIDLSTSGPRRIVTSPHSFPKLSTASADVLCSPSSMSDGGITTSILKKGTNGRLPSLPRRASLNPRLCSSVSPICQPPSK